MSGFLLLATLSGFACSSGNDNGNGEEIDPCDEITCKAHSYCEEGVCHCNDGFHEEGGSCLPDNPCRFLMCGENQTCEGGFCLCEEGFHQVGDTCMPDDACVGVTCGADEVCHSGVCVPDPGECCEHGTLDESGPEPVCICDDGYNDEDGDLLCGPDVPAEWPPDVDDLYNGADMLGNAECLLPECHDCGYPGDADVTGLWTRHTKTVRSNCLNTLMNSYDARTILGNESDEPDVPLGIVVGSCRWDTRVSPPRVAGAMMGNALAGCVDNERIMGVHSIEYESVTCDPDTDTISGTGKVWIIAATAKPELGVPCNFELELTYTRQ
jgi:hypothetical protein